MPDATQLSLLSEDELTRLEKKVREGLKAFVEVGNALLKIQQNRGYALRGYKTFEAYCLKEFGFTDRHGRRMITAAQTAGDVQKAIGQAPASESVARELTAIANDPVTLQKVQDKLGKKKTDIAHAPAEAVAEAVAAVTGKSRPEPKPAPKANGHKPEKAADSVTGLAPDACPKCRVAPGAYRRGVFGWQCGACGLAVKISVSNVVNTPVASKAKSCKNCGAELQAGVSLCFKCGEVAR